MQNVKRIGNYTIGLENEPKIIGRGSIGGKKEGEGPLGKKFDVITDNCRMGTETFEKGESALQKRALEEALKSAGLRPTELEVILGGDLLNQCIGTSFGIGDFGIPFLGLYGACSTMAESLLLASILVDGGYVRRAAAITSSHFCAAERQYRYPLEYGGQRTQNAQWTVTGSGCVIVGTEGKFWASVKEVTPGRIINYEIADPANMGAAMAPSAADTLMHYFSDTGKTPEDFDLIVTGDLAAIGANLLIQFMSKEGFDLSKNYTDCGLLIYDREKQDVHAGGSGCGCSATVLCTSILPKLESGELRDVLFLATGALMSPTSSQQGQPILGVAHLIHLQSPRGGKTT